MIVGGCGRLSALCRVHTRTTFLPRCPRSAVGIGAVGGVRRCRGGVAKYLVVLELGGLTPQEFACNPDVKLLFTSTTYCFSARFHGAILDGKSDELLERSDVVTGTGNRGE